MNEQFEVQNRGGGEVVRVPLRPGEGRYATISQDDYARLLREGVRPGPWFIVKAGRYEYVRAYCRGATGKQITVARAVLGAGRRRSVRYVTGDRTDLRRGNLDLAKGSGK